MAQPKGQLRTEGQSRELSSTLCARRPDPSLRLFPRSSLSSLPSSSLLPRAPLSLSAHSRIAPSNRAPSMSSPSSTRRRRALLGLVLVASHASSALASPLAKRDAVDEGGYYNPTSNGGRWLTVRRSSFCRLDSWHRHLALHHRASFLAIVTPVLRLTLCAHHSTRPTLAEPASPSTSSSLATRTRSCAPPTASTTGPSRSTLAATSSTVRASEPTRASVWARRTASDRRPTSATGSASVRRPHLPYYVRAAVPLCVLCTCVASC